MSNRGVSHVYTAVPRPVRDGKYLVRWSSGFSLATPKVAVRLSPDVCAFCGMGPTDIQRRRLAAGGSGRHTAKPALDFVLRQG
jgi:hypothetical protein